MPKFLFPSALLGVCLVACGGDGSEKAGNAGPDEEPPDTTIRMVEADSPLIEYVGRVGFSYPKSPEYSSPAVKVRVRFKGVGVAVHFEDQFAYGTNKNYFDAVLDGEVLPKVEPTMGVTRYELATELDYGEHELSFVKRTEASIGRTLFTGIEVQGELVPPPGPKARKIEIIGDSISCGGGVEATTTAQCTEGAGGWGVPHNNARLAFGSLVAENLDADYHVTAVSGIGLLRNYSDMYDARPMPEVYDTRFLQSMSSPLIDPQAFVPDAILIVLGTNDFSPGDNPPEDPREPMDVAEYAEAYIAFIDQLLADDHYPDAHIFALGSPMLTDGWPSATDTFRADLESALTLVEEHYAAEGNTQVHKLFVPKVPGRGCGTHPGVDEHAETATLVEPFVRETMGW